MSFKAISSRSTNTPIITYSDINTPSKEALEVADRIGVELATIIDRHFEPLRQRAEQAEARVKELQKQEAESRRLFYAEQDKRQSAEFRCEELAGALRNIIEIVREDGSDEGYDRAIAREAEIALDPSLARHAAGEPEAQT